jgi:hypothetical protein
MQSLTSLTCTTADLSAAAFRDLVKLPHLRKLRLVRPQLSSPTFESIPENAVEVLELVYNGYTAFESDQVPRLVSQLANLKHLRLFVPQSWIKCEELLRDWDAFRNIFPSIEISQVVGFPN